MKIASIDIGTNTALMYLAESDPNHKTIKSIGNFYRIPRLGKGLQESGIISTEKEELLSAILLEYLSIASENGCQKIIASGTFPFRYARNAAEVTARIAGKTGISIETLSAEKEAFYSFLGASYSSQAGRSCAVIDIGGGSSELSSGSLRKLEYRKSIPIGAVNMTEKYMLKPPLSESEFREISEFVLNELEKEYQLNTDFEDCYAIAGTPVTLACMKLGLSSFDEEKIDGCVLKLSELRIFLKLLKETPAEKILLDFGEIVKGRHDILFMGTLILTEILTHLKKDFVTVNSKGLRHGALYDYLFRMSGMYFELL